VRSGSMEVASVEILQSYNMICPSIGLDDIIIELSLCLTKHHAMKAYWGSGGIAPLILELGTR
jgi:hypothetical protein